VVVLIAYYWCLPSQLFNESYSTVLVDQKDQLLSASIASDGQWRFPEATEVPDKFIKALVTYEDKRFWNHPGVDVLSLGRALKQNIQSGKVVSGGSTLDMQVIRLSRKGASRNIVEKIIESILATRLQWSYTKKEILGLYASHAPFGGNVVGLEAACWRYLGRDPKELSWAEAAMFAVLPNAPSLIHLGKNRNTLLAKRNQLLLKLKELHEIDELTYELAISEPIPDKPLPLPRLARHLLDRSAKEGFAQQRIYSTIQMHMQQRVEQILRNHHQRLSGNEIHNISAIVVEVETGNVLAYVGNLNADVAHGRDVDVVTAPRSTGSILKPFLFAAMLDDGKMLPKTLLADVPTLINGFAPQNFTREYDGAVPADKALIRSLNVPAVHMLRDYRYEKFYELLKNMGMTTLHQNPDHYGLSLILGGSEGTLWDITGMYASMMRTLNNYFTHPGKNRYKKSDFHSPIYVLAKNQQPKNNNESLEESSWLSASSIYQTFDALQEVYRPGEETGWRYFANAKKIAWKTGTSFGFRDGWAVGVTPRYAVGVWAGNADGEGRPGLTGTEAAAPILFDIFSIVPSSDWVKKPLQEMKEVVVCKKSGNLATEFCDERDTIWVTNTKQDLQPCSNHKLIHVSADKKFRVHSECESVDKIAHVNWFVLPPVQEYYFKSKNPSYKSLPPFRPDCQSTFTVPSMDLLYPKPGARIFIPRELDGSSGSSVFELAHRNMDAIVYWHLDGKYMGETQKMHQIKLNPGYGDHILVLIDGAGEVLERRFEVISKM
jgi:penicillin-binding protein 1C